MTAAHVTARRQSPNVKETLLILLDAERHGLFSVYTAHRNDPTEQHRRVAGRTVAALERRRWAYVIEYEYEVRKARLTAAGRELAEALDVARLDTTETPGER